MSDTQEVQATPSRQEAIEAAAAAIEVDAPEAEAAPVLTKDDVAGEKAVDADAKGDRELVAPSIREFIRSQAPAAKPEGLEKEVSDLREALDGLAAPLSPEEQTFEQKMLAKLESLETRFETQDAENTEAREEEEYNNRVRSMREGVIANIDADKDSYPGLIALEQQETVFNALVQRLQEGTDTSEVEIASEVEEGLQTVYKTLHAVYGSAAPSEDQPTSERKQTLTPGLSSTTDEPNIDTMSRAERIEYLWAKNNPES